MGPISPDQPFFVRLLEVFQDRDSIDPALWIAENASMAIIEAGWKIARTVDTLDELQKLFAILRILKQGFKRRRFETFTNREKTVIRYMAAALPSKKIAEHMDVKLYTINKHRENIRRKAGVNSAAELLLYSREFAEHQDDFSGTAFFGSVEKSVAVQLARGLTPEQIATLWETDLIAIRVMIADLDRKADFPLSTLLITVAKAMQ